MRCNKSIFNLKDIDEVINTVFRAQDFLKLISSGRDMNVNEAKEIIEKLRPYSTENPRNKTAVFMHNVIRVYEERTNQKYVFTS